LPGGSQERVIRTARKRSFYEHGMLTPSARTLMNWPYFLALFLLSAALRAGPYEPSDYRSGFTTIQTLGRDIYNSLEPQEKAMISEQPISLDTSRKPFVRLLYYKEGSEISRGVWVSQGFIDLVNQLAHAKAIDKKRRGYFTAYLKLLENSGEKIPALPDRDNPNFWTEIMLNEQLSNFNSIMGIVVGISLAEHYYGMYEKYKDQIKEDESEIIPLNKFLSREDWERAYRRGLQNAMLASCMTEGYLPLCEALSNMTHRPSWSNFFFPEGIRFSAMRKDMVKLQRKFLND
jgi:hypothetical protein